MIGDDRWEVAARASVARLVAIGIARPKRDRAAVAPRATITRPRDSTKLGFDPWVTGVDLCRGRLLVKSPLAADLVLEVLDGIRHEDRRAVDAGLVETLPNTRPAGPTNGWPCLSSWSPGCSPTGRSERYGILRRTRPASRPRTGAAATVLNRSLPCTCSDATQVRTVGRPHCLDRRFVGHGSAIPAHLLSPQVALAVGDVRLLDGFRLLFARLAGGRSSISPMRWLATLGCGP